MEIIKFRGKRVDNGEWVYGYYVEQYHSMKYKKRIDAIFYSDEHKTYRIPIDRKTIGRYFGEEDKNGKAIYEGDIINLINDIDKSINVVCEFGIARREIFENTVDITGFYFKLPNGKKTFPIVNNYCGKRDLELFEVIGNVHENIELLKTINK